MKKIFNNRIEIFFKGLGLIIVFALLLQPSSTITGEITYIKLDPVSKLRHFADSVAKVYHVRLKK